MIHSYKGGSGKTLLSYNLAKQASEMGYRVLLIEGDLDGPVFHNNFPDANPSQYFNSYLKNPKNISDYIVEHEPFDLIFASPEFSINELLRSRDYEQLLDRIMDIKQEMQALDYDIIMMDHSPGVNYLAIASLVLSDRIFLVLRPDQNSFRGSEILIEEVYANMIPQKKLPFHILVNQVPDHPKFENIINEWKIIMKHKYSFLSNFYTIPFYSLTGLNIVLGKTLLPDDDPYIPHILDILDEVGDKV